MTYAQDSCLGLPSSLWVCRSHSRQGLLCIGSQGALQVSFDQLLTPTRKKWLWKTVLSTEVTAFFSAEACPCFMPLLTPPPLFPPGRLFQPPGLRGRRSSGSCW